MIKDALIIIIDLLIFLFIVVHSAKEEKKDEGKKTEIRKNFFKKHAGEPKLTEAEKRDLEILELIEKYNGTEFFGKEE